MDEKIQFESPTTEDSISLARRLNESKFYVSSGQFFLMVKNCLNRNEHEIKLLLTISNNIDKLYLLISVKYIKL